MASDQLLIKKKKPWLWLEPLKQNGPFYLDQMKNPEFVLIKTGAEAAAAAESEAGARAQGRGYYWGN